MKQKTTVLTGSLGSRKPRKVHFETTENFVEEQPRDVNISEDIQTGRGTHGRQLAIENMTGGGITGNTALGSQLRMENIAEGGITGSTARGSQPRMENIAVGGIQNGRGATRRNPEAQSRQSLEVIMGLLSQLNQHVEAAWLNTAK